MPPHDREQESRRGGSGPAVRAIREATGITATDLANHLGISRPYLSNIEAGRRPLPRRYVPATARALGVSPTAILWHPDVSPNAEPAPAGAAEPGKATA